MMPNEKPEQPAYPSESAEKWAKAHKLAEAGDEKKLRDLLTEMDLSPRLCRLFVVAVAEESELAQVEAAGEGMAERFAALGDEMAFASQRQAADLEESRKLRAEQRQLQAERLAAQKAIAAASAAAVQRQWLGLWLPELFGQEPPAHAGFFSSSQPAPKTADAARALGITDLYAVSPWRKVESTEHTEQKKRQYVSFSPLAPKIERAPR
jgi:hypothetical protein